jgi:hypothetical protein
MTRREFIDSRELHTATERLALEHGGQVAVDVPHAGIRGQGWLAYADCADGCRHTISENGEICAV